MKGQVGRKHGAPINERSSLLCLALQALFFVSGAILGQVFSARVSPENSRELQRYLHDYFSLDRPEVITGQEFFSALLIYFRYPLLAFFLGFSTVGALLTLPLTAVFGGFLSFSICCFSLSFGEGGALLALAVFGLRCLVTLPCYFYLAVPALARVSAALWKGKRIRQPAGPGNSWLRLPVVFMVLFAGALAELHFGPELVHLAVGQLFH